MRVAWQGKANEWPNSEKSALAQKERDPSEKIDALIVSGATIRFDGFDGRQFAARFPNPVTSTYGKRDRAHHIDCIWSST